MGGPLSCTDGKQVGDPELGCLIRNYTTMKVEVSSDIVDTLEESVTVVHGRRSLAHV